MKTDDATEVLDLYAKDFLAFSSLAFSILHPGKKLKITWYIKAIAAALVKTKTGECKQLAISMPPRVLKSMMVSVFWPAWVIGGDPSKSFICVSYSGGLAKRLALDCLTLMQSEEYRAIFPKVKLDKVAAGDIVTSKNGGRFATSFDGTTTGRGGDYVIIDDPMKPEDASSENTREKINRTYSTTLVSRRNQGAQGVMIIVGQRVHEDDLIGRQCKGEGWARLSLGATAEEDEYIPIGRGKIHHRKAGELLDSERLPATYLADQQVKLGSSAYSAQYEQRPVPAAGNLFKRIWFETRYSTLPPKRIGDKIVMSLDPASKTGPNNDFSAFVIARKVGDRYYPLDVIQRRLEFTDLLSEVQRLCELHRPHTLLIEDSASGQSLIQHLARIRPAFVPNPIPIKATVEKRVRIESITPYAERGDIILPMEAPWLAEFEQQLFGYPNGKHDDALDALTQMVIHGETTRMPIFDPIIPVNGGDFHLDNPRDPPEAYMDLCEDYDSDDSSFCGDKTMSHF